MLRKKKRRKWRWGGGREGRGGREQDEEERGVGDGRERRGGGGTPPQPWQKLDFHRLAKKQNIFSCLPQICDPAKKAQSLSREEERRSEGGRVRSLGKDGYGDGDVWVGGSWLQSQSPESRLLFLFASFPVIEMHIFLPLEIYSSLPPASLEQALLFNFTMHIWDCSVPIKTVPDSAYKRQFSGFKKRSAVPTKRVLVTLSCLLASARVLQPSPAEGQTQWNTHP